MARYVAGTVGLLALFLVNFVMTAIPNQAQGPPAGLDVMVVNPLEAPVPVTGSLGVARTPNVTVENFPEVVEVTNEPTGDVFRFFLEVGDGERTFLDQVVPAGESLTDLVISVVTSAKCTFQVLGGTSGNAADRIIFGICSKRRS